MKNSIQKIIILSLILLNIFVLSLSFPQISKAGSWTCDPTQDYGHSCVDTNGTPRCQSDYLEKCSDDNGGLYRKITCGTGGEFYDKDGGCLYDSSGNVKSTKTEADQAKTCKLGSYLAEDGKCYENEKNKQQGTDTGTKPSEGGHNSTTSNETIADANNKVSPENTNKGSSNTTGGIPPTSSGPTTLKCNDANLLDKINSTYCSQVPDYIQTSASKGNSNTYNCNYSAAGIASYSLKVGECPTPTGNFVFKVETAQGISLDTSEAVTNELENGLGVKINNQCLDVADVSQKANQLCPNPDVAGIVITGRFESENSSYKCVYTNQGKTFSNINDIQFGICNGSVFVSNDLSTNTRYQNYVANELNNETQSTTSTQTIGLEASESTGSCELILDEITSKCNVSCDGVEYFATVRKNSNDDYFCDYTVNNQTLTKQIGSCTNGNKNFNVDTNSFCTEINNLAQPQNPTSDNVECPKLGIPSRCNVLSPDDMFELANPEKIDSQCRYTLVYQAVNGEITEHNFYLSESELDSNPQSILNNSVYQESKFDAFCSGNAQGEEIFSPFGKISAQTTTPPTPQTFDPELLDKGIYLIEVPGFETAEVRIFTDNVKVHYFNDVNGDGVQQTGESDIDPKIYEIKVSKDTDISTYKLNAGWNLINLNLSSVEYSTAKAFAAYMRTNLLEPIQISKYDNGNWVHYVSRTDTNGNIVEYGNDFNLVPGESYFLRLQSGGTLFLKGNTYLSNVPINIGPGWNLVGLLSQKQYKLTELINYCINQGLACTTISEYSNGNYSSVVKDRNTFFGNDSFIDAQKGYFIFNNSDIKKIITP